MKTRIGFVSNSSSSNFVLAIRNDCVVEDIKNEILKDRKSITTLIENGLEYVNLEEEDDNLMTLKGVMFYDAIAMKIAKNILAYFYSDGYSTYMKLGDWKISAAEWGTEGDGDLLGLYFYGASGGNIDAEKIKITDVGF